MLWSFFEALSDLIKTGTAMTSKISSLAPAADGTIPGDLPAVTRTEKVIEEKEALLRRYIEANYSKIRNVERELGELAMEVKLTSGPKKSALELLRKKIEVTGEKILAARQREAEAKEALKQAISDVKEAEEEKQALCADLTTLVEQAAAAQFGRLEELTRKLDALNPELGGGAHLVLSAPENKAQQLTSAASVSTAQQGISQREPRWEGTREGGSNSRAPASTNGRASQDETAVDKSESEKRPSSKAGADQEVLGRQAATNSGRPSSASSSSGHYASPPTSRHQRTSAASDSPGTADHVEERVVVSRNPRATGGLGSPGQHGSLLKGKGRGGSARGRLGLSNSRNDDSSKWTGAGFDVDDGR